jgi:hypothetical protein
MPSRFNPLIHTKRYSPATNSWAPAGSMPTARDYLVAVTGTDGRIYVIGGLSGGVDVNVVERYDPSTGLWDCSQGDNSPACHTASLAPMPTARAGMAATLGPDGRIYVVGGDNGTGRIASVEAYDPGRNQWSILPSMPTPRGNLGVTTSPEGQLYAIGGFTGVTDTNAVERYSLDRTPPVITPMITGTLGNNGWYTSNVSVNWNVSDPESGIASSSGCGATLLTTDTAGTTLTCSAINGVGLSSSQSVTVKRDATPPTLTGTPDRPPDHNGWYNHPVTVSWSGNADDISGIASCDRATPYSGPDSAAASVSGHCTDGAGNVGTGSYSFKYDASKPNISTVLSPPSPASTGWYNIATGAPTVTFPCSDATSGIDGSCPAAYTFPEGANQSHSATVSDVAGNTNSAGVSAINVDLTPPTCTVTMTPSTIWPPNHKMVSVNASVTVADGSSGPNGFVLSGITSNEGDAASEVQGFSIGQAGTSGQVLADRSGTGTGRVYTFTYSAMDKAGNTSTCSGTVKVPHDQGRWAGERPAPHPPARLIPASQQEIDSLAAARPQFGDLVSATRPVGRPSSRKAGWAGYAGTPHGHGEVGHPGWRRARIFVMAAATDKEPSGVAPSTSSRRASIAAKRS